MFFPSSGAEISPLLPPIIAFVLAFICSTAGVTGAFLLLPIQVSILGIVGPSATATNHLYNVFAGTGGAIRYLRERRLLTPLAFVLFAGSIPGILCGILIRIHFLPEPYSFKLFIGSVLLVMAVNMSLRNRSNSSVVSRIPPSSILPSVHVTRFTPLRLEYSFLGNQFSIVVPLVFGFSFIVGLVGGAYGMGGGALNSSFLIGILGLPVHTTAGATLLATLVSSLTGALGFAVLAPFYAKSGIAIAPDWVLGSLFGIGGFAGTYLGARLQRFIPARTIRTLLAILLLALAAKYAVESIQHILH